MRLLIVINDLGLGGAQRQMSNLAQGLCGRGHEVDFFCYTTHDLLSAPLRKQGVLLWLSPHKKPVSGLRDRMRQGGYDLVLACGTAPGFHAILASRSLLRGPKIVVSERLGVPAGLTARLARQLYRYGDYVLCNSLRQRDALAKDYPRLDGRIDTIFNGCDLELFRPAPGRPPAGHLRILAVAPVTPSNNGICLVRALKILRDQKVPPPQITWLGERFPHGSGPACFAEMRAEINKSGLAPQWTWLEPRPDVVELMQAHDVLVHPSRAEGLPNVVCEALACGLPVIASNVLDHPKLVQEGLSGFLFDPGNPEDLAAALRRLQSFPPEPRAKLSANARRYAETHLSLATFLSRHEYVFTSLVSPTHEGIRS